VPYEENEQRGFHSESSSTDEDDDDAPAPAPVQRGPKGGRIGPRLYVSCSIVILRWQVSMRQNVLYRMAVRAEDKDFHPIHSNRKHVVYPKGKQVNKSVNNSFMAYIDPFEFVNSKQVNKQQTNMVVYLWDLKVNK